MKIFYTWIFISFFTISFAQTFKVSSVSPAPNSLSAEKNQVIQITFTSSIDVSSFNDTSFMVFGKFSGPAAGTITFNNDSTILTFTPSGLLFSGEMIVVSLSKNIKSKLGNKLEKGYAFNYWIKTSPGSLLLTKKDEINVRKPGEGWIQTYGAYAGDLNDDDYTDFLVPNERPNDVRVFLNDSSGGYSSFTTFNMPGAFRPSTNDAADFNLDGIIDIAVGSSAGDSITVFLGDGNGGFFSIKNYAAADQVRGLSVMDLNGDGLVDIATANRIGSNISLIMNNGNGSFLSPVNIEGGGSGETACAAADVNNDGIMDLYVGAYSSKEIILLLGDGNGGLNFKSKVSVPGSPWMVFSADVNNDGIPDVLSANSQSSNFSVVKSDINGNLSAPVTYTTGAFPIAIDAGDLDGDGDMDVVTSNFSSGNFTVFKNDGLGSFSLVNNLPSPETGSCAVFHDRDNDGDLDMTGIDENADVLILFENTGPTNVKDPSLIPENFSLYQNYPNPFNPVTKIKYALSREVFTTLKIFDVLGNEIESLVNELKSPGEYEVEFNADKLTSGIYFYTIKAGNFSESKKMILIK